MSNPFWIVVKFASMFRRLLPFVLLLFAVVAFRPEAARADDAQAAGVAVDLFVRGSQVAGLPISETEAEVVKQIVTCGLNGTEIGSCVRNMAVAVALKELGAGNDVAGAASCLISGKPAVACVNEAVVKGLPEAAQPMVSPSGRLWVRMR